jgi:hypothetical protein
MKYLGLAALWLLPFGCISGGGTETDNPATTLKDFSGSACKSKVDATPQALTLETPPELEGLECVEWERSPRGALSVRWINSPQSCADEYHGRAELNDSGALELSVYKDVCAVAACGSCLFDFAYDLSGTFEAVPLTLRLGNALCAKEPIEWTDQVTLPLDEQESGMLCRPLAEGPLFWYAATRGTCGTTNMPCGDCSDDHTTCEAGASCVTLAEEDARCLPDCETDDDCLADVASCEAGSCRVKASF